MDREITIKNQDIKFQLAKPMRYHLTPTNRAKIKKFKQQLEFSNIAGGTVKWCNYFENLFGSFH